jgi:hypothetical protein
MTSFCEYGDELSYSIKAGSFLIGWVTTNFWMKTLYHIVKLDNFSGYHLFFFSFLHLNELTNSMEHSPWQANGHSASQEIPHISGILKLYCTVQ